MDQKQFEAFQATMQWAQDEVTREREGARTSLNLMNWATAYAEDGEFPLQPTKVSCYQEVTCTSTRCLAGNAVFANGDMFVVPTWAQDKIGSVLMVSDCMDSNGNIYPIVERAAEICGLTTYEARSLFMDLIAFPWEEIVKYATEVADRYGYTLELV